MNVMCVELCYPSQPRFGSLPPPQAEPDGRRHASSNATAQKTPNAFACLSTIPSQEQDA
jgi:hypothetical protein